MFIKALASSRYGLFMAVGRTHHLRLKKERHSKRVGTRQYRSPEVVLGLPWDEKTDVTWPDCRHSPFELWSKLYTRMYCVVLYVSLYLYSYLLLLLSFTHECKCMCVYAYTELSIHICTYEPC